jgi:hypothetical protein
MHRRLSREDLLASGAPFREEGRISAFRWRVYENYELVGPGEEDPRYEATIGVSRGAYMTAVSADIGDAYEPLSDVPYLFLEFARLEERRDREEAIREWISKYGLLGLHRHESSVYVGPRNFRYKQIRTGIEPAHEFSDQGGPDETLRAFYDEVRHANKALACWEAAHSSDEEQLERALSRHLNWDIEGESLLGEVRKTFGARARRSGVTYADILVHVATSHALVSVQEVLQEFAYPYIASGSPRRRRIPDHLYSPDGLAATWWPRNLLGAMYLQMYWLMTSSGDLARCKHCRRIISYAPPVQVGDLHNVRKPRKDKEFCDSRCRQNYHYQNRVKPARKRADG